MSKPDRLAVIRTEFARIEALFSPVGEADPFTTDPEVISARRRSLPVDLASVERKIAERRAELAEPINKVRQEADTDADIDALISREQADDPVSIGLATRLSELEAEAEGLSADPTADDQLQEIADRVKALADRVGRKF